jgi:Rap1a immunity proteins
MFGLFVRHTQGASMFQFLRIVFIAAIVANCGRSFAEDIDSANYAMPACREVAMQVQSAPKTYARGSCMGIIETLRFTGSMLELCIPNAVTNGQMVRVVVKYIDDRPARMHENFKALAIEALRAAWPCEK